MLKRFILHNIQIGELDQTSGPAKGEPNSENTEDADGGFHAAWKSQPTIEYSNRLCTTPYTACLLNSRAFISLSYLTFAFLSRPSRVGALPLYCLYRARTSGLRSVVVNLW